MRRFFLDSLAWTGAFLSLALIGLILAQFAWMGWSERSLRRAAEAACREALAPRATLATAEHAARGALGPRSPLARRAQLSAEIRRRDFPPSGEFNLQPGDAITIRLSTNAGAAAPAWLARWGLPLRGLSLVGSASGRRP